MFIHSLVICLILFIKNIHNENCNIHYAYKSNLNVLDVWFQLSTASDHIDISWKLIESLNRTTVRLSRKSLIKCDTDKICSMSIFDLNRLASYLFVVETEACTQPVPLKIYRSLENYVIDYTINEDSKIVFQSDIFRHKKYICHVIAKTIDVGNGRLTINSSTYNYCDEPSFEISTAFIYLLLSVQVKDMSFPIEFTIKKHHFKASPYMFTLDTISSSDFNIVLSDINLNDYDLYKIEHYHVGNEPPYFIGVESKCLKETLEVDKVENVKFTCDKFERDFLSLRLHDIRNNTTTLRSTKFKNKDPFFKVVNEFNQFKILMEDVEHLNDIEYVLDELSGANLDRRSICNKHCKSGCIGYTFGNNIVFEKKFKKSYRLFLSYDGSHWEQFIEWKPSLIKVNYYFEQNKIFIWSNIPEEYQLSCLYTLVRVDTFMDAYNQAGTYDSYGKFSNDGYKLCSNNTIDLVTVRPKSLHIYIPQLNYLHTVNNLYEKFMFTIKKMDNTLKIMSPFYNEYCFIEFVQVAGFLQMEYENWNNMNVADNAVKCDSFLPISTSTAIGLSIKLGGLNSVFYVQLFYHDEKLDASAVDSTSGNVYILIHNETSINDIRRLVLYEIDVESISAPSLMYNCDSTCVNNNVQDGFYYKIKIDLILAKTVYLAILLKDNSKKYKIIQIPNPRIEYNIISNNGILEIKPETKFQTTEKCKFSIRSYMEPVKDKYIKLIHFDSCNQTVTTTASLYKENELLVYNKGRLLFRKSFMIYRNRLVTGLRYEKDKIFILNKYQNNKDIICQLEYIKKNKVDKTESKQCHSLSIDMNFFRHYTIKLTVNDHFENLNIEGFPFEIMWNYRWRSHNQVLIYRSDELLYKLTCCYELSTTRPGSADVSVISGGYMFLDMCKGKSCDTISHQIPDTNLEKDMWISFKYKFISQMPLEKTNFLVENSEGYYQQNKDGYVYYKNVFNKKNTNRSSNKWYLKANGILSETKTNIKEITEDQQPEIKYIGLKPGKNEDYKLVIFEGKTPKWIKHYYSDHPEFDDINVDDARENHKQKIKINCFNAKCSTKFMKYYIFKDGEFKENSTLTKKLDCEGEHNSDSTQCSIEFELEPGAIIKLCLVNNEEIEACKIYKTKEPLLYIRSISFEEKKREFQISTMFREDLSCVCTSFFSQKTSNIWDQFKCESLTEQYDLGCSDIKTYIEIKDNMMDIIIDNKAEFNGFIKLRIKENLQIVSWGKNNDEIIVFPDIRKIVMNNENHCSYTISGENNNLKISKDDSETNCDDVTLTASDNQDLLIKYKVVDGTDSMDHEHYIDSFEYIRWDGYSGIILGETIHFHGKLNIFSEKSCQNDSSLDSIQLVNGVIQKIPEIEHLTIVCQDDHCSLTPTKINQNNFKDYEFSFILFNQRIKLATSPTIMSVNVLKMETRNYRVIYSIGDFLGKITLNEVMYDETHRECYKSIDEDITCENKQCVHIIEVDENCATPATLKIHSNRMILSETTFKIVENSLAIFEEIDTENTNQYRAVLKLKENEKTKQFLTPKILIDETSVTNECYTLDNPSDKYFSIVEILPRCLTTGSKIKYSFDYEVTSTIKKLPFYEAYGRVNIENRTIKLYIFLAYPLKSIQLTSIEIHDIIHNQKKYDKIINTLVHCQDKVCTYDHLIDSDPLISLDYFKIILASDELDELLIYYQSKFSKLTTYYNIEYMQENIKIYFDGYTILPNLPVTVKDTNGVIYEFTVPIQYTNGKFYCILQKDVLMERTSLIVPIAENLINIEGSKNQWNYEFEYFWIINKLKIRLIIDVRINLRILKINYNIYKKETQRIVNDTKKDAHCTKNECTFEIDDIETNKDYILALSSPLLENKTPYEIEKVSCDFESKNNINSDGEILIIINKHSTSGNLRMAYTISDITNKDHPIKSQNDVELTCVDNDCEFKISDVAVIKDYNLVFTIPACPNEQELLFTKTKSNFSLTHEQEVETLTKATFKIKLKLELAYDEITFGWNFKIKGKNDNIKTSTNALILPIQGGLFTFQIENVDIRHDYEIAFVSEYLVTKSSDINPQKLKTNYTSSARRNNNEIEITLNFNIPTENFLASLKYSTLTKTTTGMTINDPTSDPFPVNFICAGKICKYSLNNMQSDEYYYIYIMSDLLVTKVPVLVNKEPSSYTSNYAREYDKLSLKFSLNKDFKEIFLTWSLVDNTNNVIERSSDSLQRLPCDDKKCLMQLEKIDISKGFVFKFESDELTGVKDMIIEERVDYELKHTWDYHKLIIELTLSPQKTLNSLDIEYVIYKINIQPVNPTLIQQTINCEINVCNFEIENLTYYVDHALTLKSLLLKDKLQHNVEKEHCSYTKMKTYFISKGQLSVIIQLSRAQRKVDITYSIATVTEKEDPIISQKTEELTCANFECALKIPSISELKDYNLVYNMFSCVNKINLLIKKTQSEFELTYNHAKDTLTTVTLKIKLKLKLAYDEITFNWNLKIKGKNQNIKNSITLQTINKNDDFFTLQIESVDIRHDYEIAFVSEYLVTKSSDVISPKLTTDYEVVANRINDDISISLTFKIKADNFETIIEYSTLTKTLTEMTKKETTPVKANFVCVEYRCTYSLTNMERDEYYYISIMSDLLQTKNPTLVNKESSPFTIDYDRDYDKLSIEFSLNKHFPEIFLKWSLLDKANNVIHISNDSLQKISCASNKCLIQFESLNITKDYVFKFESDELIGVKELIIDVNWELILNDSSKLDLQLEKHEYTPQISKKFVQIWDSIVYNETETISTTNETTETNGKKEVANMFLKQINLLDNNIMNFDENKELQTENIKLKTFTSTKDSEIIYFTKALADNDIMDIVNNSTEIKQTKDTIQSTYISFSFSSMESSTVTENENKVVLAVTKSKLTNTTKQTSNIIAGDVIVIKISNNHTKKLNITFSQIIQVKKKTKDFRCCTLDSKTLRWEKTHCSILREVTLANSLKNYTCTCNHTTSYAIIFDAFDNDESLNSYYQHEISLVLSMISLLFLIVTIVSILTSNKRMKTRFIVQIWMCVTLFMFHLSFILGDIYDTIHTACFKVAIFLHYSLMSQYFALFLHSFLLFQNLVLTMKQLNEIVIKSISLLIVVLPIIIVTICCKVFPQYYVLKNNCIPFGPIKLASITIPGATILFFNLIVFFLVLRTIHKSECTTKKKSSIKKRAKQLLFLFTLLAIPMLIQLVHSALKYEFIELIANCVNTSMGIFLFFIYIVNNKDMRHHVSSSNKIRSINKKNLMSSNKSKSGTPLNDISINKNKSAKPTTDLTINKRKSETSMTDLSRKRHIIKIFDIVSNV